MVLELTKVTKEKVENTSADGKEQLELIENCLPVCNPQTCNPDTGQCHPTFKP